MSAFRHSSQRERADMHDVLSNLGEAPSAPDLSRSIMRRLGYQRVSPEITKRRRLTTWANRGGILLVAALAFAIGWRGCEAAPQIRRPAETTIPEAIHHDVQMQQQRLEGAIRGIRNISTPRLRIEPGDNQRSLPAPKPQELQDDVNRSSIAPVRWV